MFSNNLIYTGYNYTTLYISMYTLQEPKELSPSLAAAINRLQQGPELAIATTYLKKDFFLSVVVSNQGDAHPASTVPWCREFSRTSWQRSPAITQGAFFLAFACLNPYPKIISSDCSPPFVPLLLPLEWILFLTLLRIFSFTFDQRIIFETSESASQHQNNP